MRRLLWMILVLLVSAPAGAWATTYYVRPADDGNGTTFTYGASDGSNAANAFEGFADIAGLSAGDTVCLPGSDEPFFERVASLTAGVTYKGCAETQALIWSAQGLSGNRSFDSSRNVVSTATYAWSTVSTDLYKKRIDVRALMLWEDSTWLQPVDIDAASEATIIATLTAGQWGVRDTGGGTYAIYYKATSSSKSPTTAVIRCDNVPISDGTPGYAFVIDVNNVTVQHLELRGHTAVTNQLSLVISSADNILIEDALFYRNTYGPTFVANGASSSMNLIFRDVDVLYSAGTGLRGEGGTQGVVNVTIEGGHYSYSNNSYYNGTGFTASDGDGIGIGQAGGNITNLVMRRVTANYNMNAGVFLGTEELMTITNVDMRGMIFVGNHRYCYADAAHANFQIVGTLVLSGFLCDHNTYTDPSDSAIAIDENVGVRNVIIANGTISNATNSWRIKWRPSANLNLTFRNLVFYNNPGNVTADQGDFYSNLSNMAGDEVFDNIWFYSAPNANRRFARLNAAATAYEYDGTPNGLTAFNTATGATNTVINTDPELISATDFRPAGGSPLRRAGTPHGVCADVRGRVCYPDRPDIGAYQSTSGDPAATRTAR